MLSAGFYQYVQRALPDVVMDTASVFLLLLMFPVQNSPGVTLVFLGGHRENKCYSQYDDAASIHNTNM